MKVQRNILFTLLCLWGILTACANAPTAEPTATPDTSTSGPAPTSATVADADLLGDWIVVSLNGNPIETQNVPTLTFTESGNVSGEGGCNTFGGTYSTDGNGLTLSGLTTTLVACDEDTVNAQERAYLEALNLTGLYILDGDTLTLSNEAGEALVVLRRNA